MKKTRICARLLLGSILLMMPPSIVSAQENSAVVTREPDLTVAGKSEPPHSLYAGVGFGNNMIYMGSNVSQGKPFYSGTLTYGYKNELFFAASASHLTSFDPFLSFSTFSLSYNHDLNSWFDVSLSASRYQVNSSLTDTLFNNFFYGNLSLGLDWKILYTNLSTGGIFSESSGAYFQLKNSRYFKTKSFINEKAFISFDPYVNLMFGTLTSTKTADGTIIGISAPFKKSSSGGQHSSSSVSTFFGLMEADFGIPVGLNAGNLTVEAEPGYVLPAYSSTDTQGPGGFTLFINVYFRFF
jgi:hypothetical protein